MNEQVPIAEGAAAMVSDDGNHVALKFRTSNGVVSVAFPAEHVGAMISHLVGAAEQAAGIRGPGNDQNTSQPIRPIAVSDLGVAVSKADGQARMSMRNGPLNLGFTMPLRTLLGALHALEQRTASEETTMQQRPMPSPPAPQPRPHGSNGRNGRF